MDQPKAKPVEYGEFLIELINNWRATLVERAASLRQGEMQKLSEPNSMLITQAGQPVGIAEVVEGRKRLVREARQYVAVLEDMLKAHKEGKLEDCWNDDALAAVPKLTVGDIVPKKQ